MNELAAQELADVKRQFAQEQVKSEHAIEILQRQFLEEQAKSEQVGECLRSLLGVQHLRLKKFPFTSDPANKLGEGQMPAGGVIAHLTEKYGGNVHEKCAVGITVSSVAGTSPSECRRLSGQELVFLIGKGTGTVDLLGLQDPQNRADALHAPGARLLGHRLWYSPEDLGG
jgi:hypothetical protein